MLTDHCAPAPTPTRPHRSHRGRAAGRGVAGPAEGLSARGRRWRGRVRAARRLRRRPPPCVCRVGVGLVPRPSRRGTRPPFGRVAAVSGSVVSCRSGRALSRSVAARPTARPADSAGPVEPPPPASCAPCPQAGGRWHYPRSRSSTRASLRRRRPAARSCRPRRGSPEPPTPRRKGTPASHRRGILPLRAAGSVRRASLPRRRSATRSPRGG